MNGEIVKDNKYGFYRLNPIPTEGEVNEFYAKEFYDSKQYYFNNSALDVQEKQKDFFNARWDMIYKTAKQYFDEKIEGKSVFDIGFGFAQALLYLKNRGLIPSGLEPSIEGVEYARKNGIEAFHAGIENLENIVDKKYDLVMLIDVLEHLRNPIETIKMVKDKLMTKDGLFVIDVPNDFNVFQQVANAEYGLDEWWVVRPNHINYFSRESLVKLLEDNQFEIVDYYATFPLDMFLLFGDQYVGNPEVGRECHNKRVNFERLMRKHNKEVELKKIYKALADVNLGRTITIFAKLKND